LRSQKWGILSAQIHQIVIWWILSLKNVRFCYAYFDRKIFFLFTSMIKNFSQKKEMWKTKKENGKIITIILKSDLKKKKDI
jgi:hypothetical protein